MEFTKDVIDGIVEKLKAETGGSVHFVNYPLLYSILGSRETILRLVESEKLPEPWSSEARVCVPQSELFARRLERLMTRVEVLMDKYLSRE